MAEPRFRIDDSATAEDGASIWDVYESVFGDYATFDTWCAAVWEKHRVRDGFRLARAYHGDTLVGFAYGYTGADGQWWTGNARKALAPDVADAWLGGHFELVSLGVLAGARRAGIGRRLMRAVVGGRDHERLLLMTTSDAADPARRLYASEGWHVIGPGIGDATVIMAKGTARPSAAGPTPDPKADLRHYLQLARDALLWKLDGLSEYQLRRPMVPTGTNLLGLVKHLAGVEAGYLGETFGRPFPEPMPWADDSAEPNVDMWATRNESPGQIVELYRRVWKHADATVDALPLEAIGRVPWWPAERGAATLHRIVVHVIAETNRHAGHADIVRELVDGAAGLRADHSNLPPGDRDWWDGHRRRLERVARETADD